MNAPGQKENKILLDRMRAAYNTLKSNYVSFLSSLRYDNLAERKKRVKRIEEIDSDEGWENNILKSFNFEEELLVQNNGYLSFLKLLESIQKLEEINNEIGLRATLSERDQSNNEQINQLIGFM